MTVYVEKAETLTARAVLRNPTPESLDYQVQVVLYPTGTVTTPVAQSAVTPRTIAGGQQVTVDLPLSAPAQTLLCDSYILGMFRSKVTGNWEVAMATKVFEGVQVYAPGLEVVSVTWV